MPLRAILQVIDLTNRKKLKMITTANKCVYIVEQAGGDLMGFVIMGDAPDVIRSWDESICGCPEPTQAELDAVTIFVEREQKVRELVAWYDTKIAAGITVTVESTTYKLRAMPQDAASLVSLLVGEDLDVVSNLTSTTDADTTLIFDYDSIPTVLTIGQFKQVAIAYKNILKGWNTTFATVLVEIQALVTCQQ